MKKRSIRYFAMQVAEPPSIEYKVKVCIIKAKGLTHTKPEDLEGTMDLKNDLLFNQMNYDVLCDKLGKLATSIKPTATLKCSDVDDCDTVDDCIKLLKQTVA